MKIIRNFALSALAITAFISCSDDDVVTDPEVINPPAIDAAALLLNSIEEDGGIPFNADSPALTFTAAQNVFLPSVLGIDFRTDRNVVPAGPTARFPMFQGWETLTDGSRIYHYRSVR